MTWRVGSDPADGKAEHLHPGPFLANPSVYNGKMFAICPVEVEAKVRPLLKNVQLLLSINAFHVGCRTDFLLELGGVGMGGAHEREG